MSQDEPEYSDYVDAKINEQIARGWLIPKDSGGYEVTDDHPNKEELEEAHRQEIDDALVELVLQGKIEVKGLNEDGSPVWGVTNVGWKAYEEILRERGEEERE